MNVEDIEISTKPFTLKQAILLQRATNGDLEATLLFIVDRTNLTVEQAAELDVEDLAGLTIRVSQGIDMAGKLSAIGKALGKEE